MTLNRFVDLGPEVWEDGEHPPRVMPPAIVREVQAASSRWSREPNAVEVRAAVDFESMHQSWEQATTTLVSEWNAIRAAQTASLVLQVREAVLAKDLNLLASVIAPTIGQELLFTWMERVASEASAAAAEEAAAQGVLLDAAIEEAVASVLRALLEARAEASALLLARGLSESAARYALNVYGVDNLPAEEVAEAVREHLEGLSDAYLADQLGGALTQAQNAGRTAVFERAPVAKYYASELQDARACAPCRRIDETEFTSLAAAEAEYPTGGYKSCLGGARCRGTIVAVYEEETVVSPPFVYAHLP